MTNHNNITETIFNMALVLESIALSPLVIFFVLVADICGILLLVRKAF